MSATWYSESHVAQPCSTRGLHILPQNCFFQSDPKLSAMHPLVYLHINSQRALTPEVPSLVLRELVRNMELHTFTKHIFQSIITFKRRAIYILMQKTTPHLMEVEFLKKLKN